MKQITRRNAKVGLKVIRGKDWQWGNQDFDYATLKLTFGTIQEIFGEGFKECWVRVEWNNGNINSYRIEPEHDLYLYLENKQLELDF